MRNGFEMVSWSVCFPISSQSFPLNIFFKGPKSSPSNSWLVTCGKKLKILWGDLAPVPAATSRHCILSKDDPEIEFPWRLKVLSPRLFSDVPNTVWMLAPAELSAFVSVWIVFMGSFSDKLHLRLSPTWRCELGVRILHREALHLDPPVAFTFAFANDCFCVFLRCAKHLGMRCVFGGACARSRSRAVGLGPRP